MSFEADKARLIKELAEAQTEVRDDFGLAPRVDPLADDEVTPRAVPGERPAPADS